MKSYHHFGEMCWPATDRGEHGNNVEWKLRYGSCEDVIRLRYQAAEYVSAYGALIERDRKSREFVVSTIKELERAERVAAKESTHG